MIRDHRHAGCVCRTSAVGDSGWVHSTAQVFPPMFSFWRVRIRSGTEARSTT